MYNVLHILPSLNIGGSELDTIALAKEQKALGITPFIASSGGELCEKLKELGIEHITLNLSSKNPINIWKNSKKLKEIIKKYNIDIVHAHSRAPAWSAYFSTKRSKTKLITTFHGVYGHRNFLKRMYNSSMLRGDAVIAVSKYVKKHINFVYNKKYMKKIDIIHRGIDEKDFLANTEIANEDNTNYLNSLLENTQVKLKPNQKVILLLSRFTRIKGHLYLIEILQNLKRDDYICLMVGDLSQNKQYIDDIRKSLKFNWLEDKVALVDKISDTSKLIKSVDYVISASVKPESFGLTTLQAQMMKKLAIVTNIGGSKELVKDGETGFLIPHNNIPRAAKILNKVLSLPEKEYKQITESAYTQALNCFTINEATKKTLEIYKKVAGEEVYG